MGCLCTDPVLGIYYHKFSPFMQGKGSLFSGYKQGAWKCQITCSKSHTWLVTKPGFKLFDLNAQDFAKLTAWKMDD